LFPRRGQGGEEGPSLPESTKTVGEDAAKTIRGPNLDERLNFV